MSGRGTRAGEYLTIYVSRGTAEYLREIGTRTGQGMNVVIRESLALVLGFYQGHSPDLAKKGKGASDGLVAKMELLKLQAEVAERLER